MSPADLILALSTLITSLAAAIIALITVVRAGQIKAEVKTMNEMTLGQLGEATETRRIDDIPVAERTPRETRHIDMAYDDTHRPPPNNS